MTKKRVHPTLNYKFRSTPWLKLGLLTLLLSGQAMAEDKSPPTLEEFMAMSVITSAEISPQGDRVAFAKFSNDFEQDQDMSQLWLVSTDGSEPVQLTHGKKSVGEYEWSANGEWLAFTRDNELSLLRASGGESIVVELDIEGISRLRFAPDDSALYFISGPEDKSLMEAREERFGSYTVFREDAGFQHIWRLPLAEGMTLDEQPVQLTSGRDYSVVDYALSPGSDYIAFATWETPHLVDLLKGKVFVIPATGGEANLLDETYGAKSGIHWRPDGKFFAYTNTSSFPGYSDIVLKSSDGSETQHIEMDRLSPEIVRYADRNLYFEAGDRTTLNLYQLNPANERIKQVDTGGAFESSFSYSTDGKTYSYLSVTEGSLRELIISKGRKRQQLTDITAQLDGLELPRKELIQWKSYDGLEIEAVLTWPVNYVAGKPYPLFVRTHGGPTGTDRPLLAGAPRWIYLPDLLAAEGDGAFVLQTNYRGSANYGEEFQSSNLRNLGIGPARDIMAGVETLIDQGLVDPDRVGCLGWSQGGHISAMLATYSDICTAAIMGAGISDWRTYYYNTDITQFTTEYFDATPLTDDEVYAKTSPVTYIENASTPVLIQHGENDQRVPIANGYQFRQLLLDKGVEARMIVYSDMGHGPSTPKTRRAINEHALAWFREYLFEADKAEFVYPVEPEEKEPCSEEDPG